MALKGMGLMYMLDVIKDGNRVCRRPSWVHEGEVITWRYAKIVGDVIQFGGYGEIGFYPYPQGRNCLTIGDAEAADWEEYDV